jgi:hypothetical protein
VLREAGVDEDQIAIVAPAMRGEGAEVSGYASPTRPHCIEGNTNDTGFWCVPG